MSLGVDSHGGCSLERYGCKVGCMLYLDGCLRFGVEDLGVLGWGDDNAIGGDFAVC